MQLMDVLLFVKLVSDENCDLILPEVIVTAINNMKFSNCQRDALRGDGMNFLEQ